MEEAQIPWSRLAGFIRKHTHDVRNDLNSLDLESAFLEELVPPGEMQTGVARIRKQVRSLSNHMRVLSARFQTASPIAGPLPATALLTIWKERVASTAGVPEIKWKDDSGANEVHVDVEMLAAAFQEVLANASAFPPAGPIIVSARSSDGAVTFEIREPKAAPVDPVSWGQPFFSTRHGAHGLGLWTAKRLVEANKGTFSQQFAPGDSALLTTITLPRAA